MDNQPGIKEVKKALKDWQQDKVDAASDDLKALTGAATTLAAEAALTALETAFPDCFPKD
ncbi:hypothetical protein [Loigolactobacillus bifermentans]|uniref:hypothetical protein n=1 Tax=Loigolactobacillus bifermentans TaxID=1607 RepID=UPI00070E66C0|nr:hypothetical protein [Loigolactobacillus bifermentans]QGG59598.1 hypothetical protein LB003_03380 [Loigolactobacillus bifermentans]